jgi:hypothetical protein
LNGGRSAAAARCSRHRYSSRSAACWRRGSFAQPLIRRNSSGPVRFDLLHPPKTSYTARAVGVTAFAVDERLARSLLTTLGWLQPATRPYISRPVAPRLRTLGGPSPPTTGETALVFP